MESLLRAMKRVSERTSRKQNKNRTKYERRCERAEEERVRESKVPIEKCWAKRKMEDEKRADLYSLSYSYEYCAVNLLTVLNSSAVPECHVILNLVR